MDYDLGTIAVAPLILALVQLFKMMVSERYHRYAPLLSLALGLSFAWLTMPVEQSFKSSVIEGLILGLSASGLYSASKATMAGRDGKID